LIEVESTDYGFAQKVDPIWNEPVSTGNAGALARYEREARTSYSVGKIESVLRTLCGRGRPRSQY